MNWWAKNRVPRVLAKQTFNKLLKIIDSNLIQIWTSLIFLNYTLLETRKLKIYLDSVNTNFFVLNSWICEKLREVVGFWCICQDKLLMRFRFTLFLDPPFCLTVYLLSSDNFQFALPLKCSLLLELLATVSGCPQTALYAHCLLVCWVPSLWLLYNCQ